LRRFLPCPPGRRSAAAGAGRGALPRNRRAPAASAPAPDGPEEDTLQAQVLCDLLIDPGSRVTRVRIVGAPAGLLGAVERVAAERGVPAAGTVSAPSARKR
jgi:hypothetical protein